MTNTPDHPVALDAYEALADPYAERAPTKPFNADLERPATRSLLPALDGLDVLDAGCGPGITTAELLAEGATVVGADVSPRMLAHARARLADSSVDGESWNLVQFDMGRPLPFPDESFDLVHSSLAVTDVRDWSSLFAEFRRRMEKLGPEAAILDRGPST